MIDKLKDKWRNKSFRGNVYFSIFIILLLIPSSRMFIQSNLLRLISRSPKIEQNAEIAKVAPGALSLQLIAEDGAILNLEDLRDKGLFINLWATWCPPCVAEMPSIDDLYSKVNEDFNFALLSNEPMEKLKAFKKSKGFMFPVFQIAGGLPELMSGSNSIPQTWVLNQEGKLLLHKSGTANWSSSKFITNLTNQK